MAKDMKEEEHEIIQMIDRAQAAGFPPQWVHNAIKLISYLRSSDATIQCLQLVKHIRDHPYTEIFRLEIESMEEQDRIKNLVNRHYAFSEDGNHQLLLMRRLNSVRLKDALVRLHPTERIAKVLQLVIVN